MMVIVTGVAGPALQANKAPGMVSVSGLTVRVRVASTVVVIVTSPLSLFAASPGTTIARESRAAMASPLNRFVPNHMALSSLVGDRDLQRPRR